MSLPAHAVSSIAESRSHRPLGSRAATGARKGVKVDAIRPIQPSTASIEIVRFEFDGLAAIALERPPRGFLDLHAPAFECAQHRVR